MRPNNQVLDSIPAEKRFKFVDKRWAKTAGNILKHLGDADLDDTELLKKTKLKSRRYQYEGAVSALLALRLLTILDEERTRRGIVYKYKRTGK